LAELWTKQSAGRGRLVLMYSLGVLLTVGPWLAKNVVETGNPVYPLAWQIFGGRDIDSELDAKFRRGHATEPRTWGHLVNGVADVTVQNDWLSPLLFALAPLSLWYLWSTSQPVAEPAEVDDLQLTCFWRRALAGLWIYLAWLFFTWWGLTHRLDRFWVPQIPVVALLAGLGWRRISDMAWETRIGKYSLQGIGLASLAVLGFNLVFVLSGLAGNNTFFVELNQSRKNVTQRFTPGIDFLNTQLPPGSKVLCVGEAQVFPLESPLVYNSVFDRSLFEEWLAEESPGVAHQHKSFRPVAEMKARLKREGITHIHINWAEIARYRKTYGYTPFVTPARFAKLQSLGVLQSKLSIPKTLNWSEISESEASDLRTWAPELVRTRNDTSVMVLFEVYPVAL